MNQAKQHWAGKICMLVRHGSKQTIGARDRYRYEQNLGIGLHRKGISDAPCGSVRTSARPAVRNQLLVPAHVVNSEPRFGWFFEADHLSPWSDSQMLFEP